MDYVNLILMEIDPEVLAYSISLLRQFTHKEK